MIISIVLILLLFYVPKFAIAVICVILVAGVIGGILLYKYKQKRK
jgi:hypothetical protein